MTTRSRRYQSYDHISRLTPAEELFLREYAKNPCVPEIAKKLGLTNSCLQIRGKSIREKLAVKSLEEALYYVE